MITQTNDIIGNNITGNNAGMKVGGSKNSIKSNENLITPPPIESHSYGILHYSMMRRNEYILKSSVPKN